MLSFLNGPIRMYKPKQTVPSTIPMSRLAIGLFLLLFQRQHVRRRLPTTTWMAWGWPG